MNNNVVYENRIKHVEVWTEDYLKPIPHLHKELELIYVVNGESHLFIDNRKMTISDGDLFICFPNQIHCYESSVHGQYFLFTISPDFCIGIKDLLSDNVPENNILKLGKDDDIIRTLFSAVAYYGNYKETYYAGCINHALAMILQNISITPRIQSNSATLQSIIRYCTGNFLSDITLDDMARELHLSKYHISHLLNNKLGISFSGYINMLRINNACELLRRTDKSIASISEESGFGSIRTFNRVFMQIMNTTPYEYRAHN